MSRGSNTRPYYGHVLDNDLPVPVSVVNTKRMGTKTSIYLRNDLSSVSLSNLGFTSSETTHPWFHGTVHRVVWCLYTPHSSKER